MSRYCAWLRTLQRLLSRQPAPVSAHRLPVAVVPDLDEPALSRWITTHVTCLCGRVGCVELSIAVVLPQKEPPAEA